MDELTCGICGQQCSSKAALGSHQRYSHGIVGEHGKVIETKAADSAKKKVDSVLSCPDCGGPLTLQRSGPGLYVLKCQSCWDSE